MSQVRAITFGGLGGKQGRGVTVLRRRQSDCGAILEEQIALSKYTDSL